MEEKNKVKVNMITFICIAVIIFLLVVLGELYSQYTKLSVTTAVSKVDNAEENIVKYKYSEYQENYTNSYKELINENSDVTIYLGDERKNELPGVFSISLDSNNDVYFNININSDIYTEYGEKYKVSSNVANIYVCAEGNGGYSDAIFVNLDGTVDYVSGYIVGETSKIVCNRVENVKDIVNVISYYSSEDGLTGVMDYAFVDINGNIVK